MKLNTFLCLAGLTLSSSFGSVAQADDAPATGTGGAGGTAASTGKTEITAEGKFAAVEKDAKDAKDATELTISGGGLLATGNARLFAGTLNEKFRLRRESNQLRISSAVNYGRTGVPGSELTTNVENYQGLARYDRFLGDFTLFTSLQARRDRFQGLNVRLQADPGAAYYFVNKPDMQFWSELGYNFMHDIRSEASLETTDKTTGVVTRQDKTRTVHSSRLYTGFSVKMNDNVTWSVGAEYLQGLSDTGFYRVNADTLFSAKITKSFALQFAFAERYESKPVLGKEKLDTTTSINLVFQAL